MSAGAALIAQAGAQTPAATAAAAPSTAGLRPLSFDPARLDGLSEKIRSHWENNYGGSVRTLAAVKQRLAEALASGAPHRRLLQEHPVGGRGGASGKFAQGAGRLNLRGGGFCDELAGISGRDDRI
jgi:hypothetical protein